MISVGKMNYQHQAGANLYLYGVAVTVRVSDPHVRIKLNQDRLKRLFHPNRVQTEVHDKEAENVPRALHLPSKELGQFPWRGARVDISG